MATFDELVMKRDLEHTLALKLELQGRAAARTQPADPLQQRARGLVIAAPTTRQRSLPSSAAKALGRY